MKFIKRNYNYLIFAFFFISVSCWCLEIVFSLIDRGKFVLPGAWNGPYCPIYGLCFLILLALLRKKDSIFLNILKIFITVSVVEYIISFISGEIFSNVIWDYSDKFLNINGRICLEMSLLFTVLGSMMMYLLEPIIRRIYIRFERYIKYTNIAFIIIFIIDISYKIISNL